jgi:hypothetical protein
LPERSIQQHLLRADAEANLSAACHGGEPVRPPFPRDALTQEPAKLHVVPASILVSLNAYNSPLTVRAPTPAARGLCATAPGARMATARRLHARRTRSAQVPILSAGGVNVTGGAAAPLRLAYLTPLPRRTRSAIGRKVAQQAALDGGRGDAASAIGADFVYPFTAEANLTSGDALITLDEGFKPPVRRGRRGWRAAGEQGHAMHDQPATPAALTCSAFGDGLGARAT